MATTYLLGASEQLPVHNNDNIKAPRVATQTVTPCSLATGWSVPVDVEDETSDEECARFAWDTFVALNWPHLEGGANGEPDKNTSICDGTNARTVWSSWLEKEQTFLPNGEDPGTYNNPTYPKPMYGESPEEQLPLIGALAKASLITNITGAFDQADSASPLIDQNGNYFLYQIKLNQSEFQYLTQHGYYDKKNQLLAFEQEPISFAGMPRTGQNGDQGSTYDLPDYAQQGVVEIKVAWKQLTQEEIDSGRFYTQEVYYLSNLTAAYPACGPTTLGFVGMHIQRLTETMKHTWFWATFEHVDLVESPNPDIAPLLNPGADSAYPPPYPDGYSCVDSAPNCPPLQVVDGSGHDVCTPFEENIVNVSSIPELAPSALITSINTEYQDALPAPWKYYKLIDTIHPDPNGPACIMPDTDNKINTAYLTNTSMESYTLYMNDLSFTKCGANNGTQSINCTDCHAAGLPWGAQTDPEGFPLPTPDNPNGTDYQIFSFLLFAAQRSCPGDVDVNDTVDVQDLLLCIDQISEGCAGDCLADANDDFVVNVHDLLIVIGAWGDCE